MEWHDWCNIRQKLITFGRAVQGLAPYKVEVETDSRKCPTAYCDYTNRMIVVNPTIFPRERPNVQYNLTRALLVHEAGHRRFTTPMKTDPLLHRVMNILEDQRIEYLMHDSFSGLRRLIRELAVAFYETSPAMHPTDNSPMHVLGALLEIRWGEWLGKPLKGKLSAKNEVLYDKVLPLAKEAWIAPDTQTVHDLAQRIIAILGLKPTDALPSWVQVAMDSLGDDRGERAEDDAPEAGSAGSESGGGLGAGDGDKGMPVLESTASEGPGEFAIEPKPYVEMLDKATPLAQELADELALAWREGGVEYAARGRRLSVRVVLHNPEEPFLAEAEVKSVPDITFRVLIDHSTSMNLNGSTGRPRIESVADGVMMLHLFGAMAGIEHEVAVFPNDVRLASLHSGERGLALIAGMAPALTWWEDLGLTMEIHAKELDNTPADLKVMFCLHDGFPNDGDVAKQVCRDYRGRVEIIGVGIDLDASCATEMAKIFPDNRLLLCQKAEELPRKLAAAIRSIYGL